MGQPCELCDSITDSMGASGTPQPGVPETPAQIADRTRQRLAALNAKLDAEAAAQSRVAPADTNPL
jgi:hypothetical protein